jgi:hypothetical protein
MVEAFMLSVSRRPRGELVEFDIKTPGKDAEDDEEDEEDEEEELELSPKLLLRVVLIALEFDAALPLKVAGWLVLREPTEEDSMLVVPP